MFISTSLIKIVTNLLSEYGYDVSYEDIESFNPDVHRMVRIHRLGVAFLRILEWSYPIEDLDPDGNPTNIVNQGNYISFIINNRFRYFLKYDECGFYLFCSKKYPADALNKVRKNLLYLNRQLIFEQEGILKKNLEKKKLAIKNSINKDLEGIDELAKTIEQKYMDNAEMMGDGSILNLIWLNSQIGMEGERVDCEFEISCYIQKVFSLIEHFSMCLLPLWEYSDSSEWKIIKQEAGKYFIPDTWTTFLLHKDDFKDFMIFFEAVMKVSNRELQQEYRSAKDDLRNVITHGYLTSMRLDNMTINVPSLIDGCYDYTDPSFIQLDYFAFKRAEHLLHMYLEWVQNLNPAFYCLVTRGLDIPANAMEVVNFVGNDVKKAEEFVSRWDTLYYDFSFSDGFGPADLWPGRPVETD